MIMKIEVEVPDGVVLGDAYDLWEGVVSEARKTFCAKNDDYWNCWRLRSERTISDEIQERCLRIQRLLDLQAEGRQPQVAEGIESEFKDMINWAVFGVLIARGYGVKLKDVLQSFEQKQERQIERKMEPVKSFVPTKPIPQATDMEALGDLGVVLREPLWHEGVAPQVVKIDARRPAARLPEFVFGIWKYERADALDPVNAKKILDTEGMIVFIKTKPKDDLTKEEIEQLWKENVLSGHEEYTRKQVKHEMPPTQYGTPWVEEERQIEHYGQGISNLSGWSNPDEQPRRKRRRR